MKKTLIEEQQRILTIMSQMDKSIPLTEADDKYLNFLLDKVNQSGMNSLDPLEKEDLKRLSNEEDFKKVSPVLRFTAARDASIIPKNRPYTITGRPKHDLMLSVIYGKAEELAGNEIPIFIEGDLSEVDKPEDKQHIKMFIPSGEYDCVARTVTFGDGITTYFLMLRDDKENGFE